jgi:hypothetical protein
MALRAADALVARAFSRPCRHSCRHAFGRVFKEAGTAANQVSRSMRTRAMRFLSMRRTVKRRLPSCT